MSRRQIPQSLHAANLGRRIPAKRNPWRLIHNSAKGSLKSADNHKNGLGCRNFDDAVGAKTRPLAARSAENHIG
jgi:hypothetical protein